MSHFAIFPTAKNGGQLSGLSVIVSYTGKSENQFSELIAFTIMMFLQKLNSNFSSKISKPSFIGSCINPVPLTFSFCQVPLPMWVFHQFSVKMSCFSSTYAFPSVHCFYYFHTHLRRPAHLTSSSYVTASSVTCRGRSLFSQSCIFFSEDI